jgi:hypothetical protein
MVSVWGRTPTSRTGAVVVEQRDASSWVVVARLRADSAGIFSALVRPKGKGPLRAVFPAAKATSLPFSLVSPPDHPYHPFGASVAKPSGGQPTNAAVSQYVEPGPAAALQAVLPAAGGKAPAPSTVFGAVGDALRGAARTQTLLLVAALAGIVLVFAATASRRRRPGPVQPRH